MATMTATNQQYYSSYPVAQNVSNMVNTNGVQAYQQQQYSQHQQQVQPYHQHHQHTATVNNQSLTQLGQQTQRTVSASTNSSTAAALYTMEATKSTKGASKLRRDLINTEIAQLRELLPLPASTRQRLSQLQLMALVLVYVRKSNYFCNAFSNYGIAREPSLTISASGFSKALNGFLMMLTQKGKLLYISDNAAEYLGHSMEDLLSHGDEVYDIIEDQDKKTIRTELLSNDDDSQSSPSSKSLQQSTNLPTTETRIALCRMNVSRNARRQMRFGDQKVVLIEGHYFGFLPLSSRNEPVFLASCTPIAMPETRECVVQGSTNVFTSIHSMDMKFLYIDGIGEHHLNCTRQQINGTSWYELIHTDHLLEAQQKHKRITANDQERSTIVLLRMMNLDQSGFIWVHSVMQVKEATDTTIQPVIVCTNQVLSEREAQVMRSNLWLYQFYSLHSKMHCNYSANSPSAHNDQSETPNSVCSDSEARCSSDLVGKSDGGNNTGATLNTSSAAGELSKTPPANLIIGSHTNQGESSPSRSETTFTSQDNYGSGNNGSSSSSNGGVPYSGGYQSSPLQAGAPIQLKSNAAVSISSGSNIKLSPPTQSPLSTISSSPLSSSSSYGQQHAANQHQQRYHQLTSSVITNPLINISHHSTDISVNHHHHHHHHNSNSVGSASVSSTSSSSSSSSSQNDSTTPGASTITAGANNNSLSTSHSNNVAQTMATAAGSNAANLYAGIDAIDPLQHMHHSHHHSMYSAAAATRQHPHPHHHHPSHHHAAVAVNYASQVMAAQRVAHQQSHHHHHHPYHPYHHHHHHPAVHSHQVANHVAPHHHNHHTTPHALYAPTHHHPSAAVASTAAFNSAFNHHHHHHAAAYHSAAAVAAAGANHPAHHHSASSMQNPYHSASAAAAAAAAHQGVSFHYSKIAAAVNASA